MYVNMQVRRGRPPPPKKGGGFQGFSSTKGDSAREETCSSSRLDRTRASTLSVFTASAIALTLPVLAISTRATWGSIMRLIRSAAPDASGAHPILGAEAAGERLELLAAGLDASGRAHLGAALDRHLAEVAVDVQGGRSHMASSRDGVEETRRAIRRRRIRARGTTGQGSSSPPPASGWSRSRPWASATRTAAGTRPGSGPAKRPRFPAPG
jgi:hypothetical protein